MSGVPEGVLIPIVLMIFPNAGQLLLKQSITKAARTVSLSALGP